MQHLSCNCLVMVTVTINLDKDTVGFSFVSHFCFAFFFGVLFCDIGKGFLKRTLWISSHWRVK